jgi:endonuclease III
MKTKEIREWTKKEFEDIHKLIKNKDKLSHYDFLRIRNFKSNLFSSENEETINKITKESFQLAEKDKIKEAIEKLLVLHGVGVPVASAILAMKFPNKFAIIDNRVIRKLGKDQWLKTYLTNSKTYEEYLLLLREKSEANKSNLRDFERNLFERT